MEEEKNAKSYYGLNYIFKCKFYFSGFINDARIVAYRLLEYRKKVMISYLMIQSRVAQLHNTLIQIYVHSLYTFMIYDTL